MNTEIKSTPEKQILSLNFGIGVVKGIETLNEGVEYYVVEYGNANSKNYFPVSGNRNIRFLSTEKEFRKNIDKLKQKKIKKEFQTKKERQDFFSSVLSDSRLENVVTTILEINSLSKLLPIEKDKLNKLINFLEIEASAVCKIDSDASKILISDLLANK